MSRPNAIHRALFSIWTPKIRSRLLEDGNLLDELGLQTDSVLSLGPAGPAFGFRSLVTAVSTHYRDRCPTKVEDEDGRCWTITSESNDGADVRLTLDDDADSLVLDKWFVFNPNDDERLAAFSATTKDLMPQSWVSKDLRRAIAEGPPASQPLAMPWWTICANTPQGQRKSVVGLLRNNCTDPSDYVPNSREYFARLCGALAGTATVSEFALGTAPDHFLELLNWNATKGLDDALLLTVDQSIANAFDIDSVSEKELDAVLAISNSNRSPSVAQGAIELGLRCLPKFPGLAKNLQNAISRLHSSESDRQTMPFDLMSGLLILVDGELARSGLFRNDRPFVRRFHSLAHAALIQQEVAFSSVDLKAFLGWVRSADHHYYFAQNLVDLRLEPRWLPDFASSFQLRQDCIGRMLGTALNHKTAVQKLGLGDLLLAPTPERLLALGAENLCPWLPGPIEGGLDVQGQLPPEIRTILAEKLDSPSESFESYIAVINAGAFSRVDPEYLDKTFAKLGASNNPLHGLPSKDALLQVLVGLAQLSATHRHNDLASVIQTLSRKYRTGRAFRLSTKEYLQVNFICAASSSDVDEWSHRVGQALDFLAFSEMSREELESLECFIRLLANVEPKLRSVVSRPLAAVRSAL